MPEYRRLRVAGGCYFFTVALADRGSDLLVREIAVLRAAVARVMVLRPFRIEAWVVLPEHLHAFWTLPEGDADFSGRWLLIKRGLSLAVAGGERRSASRVAKGERGIWQLRFWEHAIRDARDYAAHVDYVHFNPVKHGLVARVGDWPFSMFRRAVARGRMRLIGGMGWRLRGCSGGGGRDGGAAVSTLVCEMATGFVVSV